MSIHDVCRRCGHAVAWILRPVREVGNLDRSPYKDNGADNERVIVVNDKPNFFGMLHHQGRFDGGPYR
jgi:hypothetical protein